MSTFAQISFQLTAGRIERLAFLLALVMLLAGCATAPANMEATQVSSPPKSKLILRAGDEIELKFPYWQELNDTQVIRPDGFITPQLIESVKAEGLTPEELDLELTKLYASKIKNPVITVVVRSLVDQRIYVGGEVNKPGLLTLQGQVDVLQAVINAGGFNETASLGNVIVIRKGEEGQAIPYRVDLSGALQSSEPHAIFMMQPNDVVYVPKTVIANLDKFVNQYISELFLFRGIGFGFTYVVHDQYDRGY